MKTKITILVWALLFGLFFQTGYLSAASCSSVGFSCKSMTCANPDTESCPSGHTMDRANCNTEMTACCCVESETDDPEPACSGSCLTYCDPEQGYERDSSGDDYCQNGGETEAYCCVKDDGEDDDGGGGGSSSGNSSATGTWTEGVELVESVTELPDTNFEDLLQGILLWILRVFIVLAFIFFVITGIMYLLAGSDKNMADKAKTATFYSIIAVLVALVSYVIIRLIFDLLMGGGGQ